MQMRQLVTVLDQAYMHKTYPVKSWLLVIISARVVRDTESYSFTINNSLSLHEPIIIIE